MSDPTKYEKGYNFSGFQAVNPSTPLPATSVDNELANIEISISEAVDAIKDIRRSDGALKNGVVTLDSLAQEVKDGLGDEAVLASDAAIAAQVAAEAAQAGAEAAETGAIAAKVSAEEARDTALAAPNTFYGTSTSSATIGVGTRTFTTQADRFFQVGAWVMVVDVAAPTTNYMHGQVVSYSGTTLVVNVTTVGGAGTLANWLISLSGVPGAQGPTGAAGAGTGDMLRANNLSDLVDANTARTNLGVAIGANVQAYSDLLAALAALSASSGVIEKTGASTVGTFTVSAAGKALIDDADVAAMLATLGATATGVSIFSAANAAAVRTLLSLGAAALLDAGTSANNLVQLDGSGKLPAVDASALTNIPSTSGLVYLGSATASSSSSLPLTSLMSSTYDDYVLFFKNLRLGGTTPSGCGLQVSADNGSTWQTTSQSWALRKLTMASAPTATETGDSGGSAMMFCDSVPSSPSATQTISGELTIFGVNSTADHKRVVGSCVFTNSTPATVHATFGGKNNSTSAVNACRLIPFAASGASIVSGTVHLYGVKKS